MFDAFRNYGSSNTDVTKDCTDSHQRNGKRERRNLRFPLFDFFKHNYQNYKSAKRDSPKQKGCVQKPIFDQPEDNQCEDGEFHKHNNM